MMIIIIKIIKIRSRIYRTNLVQGHNNYSSINRIGPSLKEAWFDNGNLKFRSNFVDNRKHSLQFVWYMNGQLDNECNYDNGRKDGLETHWTKSGNLKYQINYVNGKKHMVQKHIIIIIYQKRKIRLDLSNSMTMEIL